MECNNEQSFTRALINSVNSALDEILGVERAIEVQELMESRSGMEMWHLAQNLRIFNQILEELLEKDERPLIQRRIIARLVRELGLELEPPIASILETDFVECLTRLRNLSKAKRREKGSSHQRNGLRDLKLVFIGILHLALSGLKSFRNS